MDQIAGIINSVRAEDRAVVQAVADLVTGGASREHILERAVAILKAARKHYTWLGIYLLEDDTLVLGPFIGRPTEHVRIPIGSGICGLAARTKETVNVEDVNADPRYLACSLETKSELVVPIMDGNTVLGEIDVDSDDLAAFKEDDEQLLKAAARLLAGVLSNK